MRERRFNAPVLQQDARWPAFSAVVRERRSVRKYLDRPVREADMRDILEAGVLAPTSSNLQPFELVWVRSPVARAKLVQACLNQSAARTARELVVVVARWDRWNQTRKELAAWLDTQPTIPKAVRLYYDRLAQTYYGQGPLSLFGRSRRVAYALTGLFRPVMRGPCDREDMRVWAVKSSALVAENIILAARAKGLDTCPMEGNDPVRVGKLIGLAPADFERTWDITMVLSVGYRGPRGLWGKRWRRDRDRLIREI